MINKPPCIKKYVILLHRITHFQANLSTLVSPVGRDQLCCHSGFFFNLQRTCTTRIQTWCPLYKAIQIHSPVNIPLTRFHFSIEIFHYYLHRGHHGQGPDLEALFTDILVTLSICKPKDLFVFKLIYSLQS